MYIYLVEEDLLMTSNNKDKRLAKGEETYNRILLSAIDIISESGISGITASKLSELSQMSKSNIFHHFKSINDIPEEVLKFIFSELIKPIDDVKIKDLDEFLKYLGSSIVYVSEEYKKIYKSFFSFYHESMFNEIYKTSISDYLNTSKISLIHQIKKYSRRSLTDHELNSISTLILAALDGIGLHILMHGKSDEYLEAWNLQVKFICSWLNNF